jgi:hypothetical protein
LYITNQGVHPDRRPGSAFIEVAKGVVDDFESLSHALDGWFDADLDALPAALRDRVLQDFFPLAWEQLSPKQRLRVAAQWDQQHDPALEGERHRAWDLVSEMSGLKGQIEQWKSVSAPTAKDLDIKEAKLVELRQSLARVEAQMRGVGTGVPVAATHLRGGSQTAGKGVRYLAYPAALAQLRGRLNATPEELAAWIFMGPKVDGLAAFLNANELDPPPRFHFPLGNPTRLGEDHDYLAPMMACWFRVDEIERFQPTERYMVGRDLIARWSKVSGIDSAAYIRAKIQESRLLDAHPIYGGTRGTFPDDEGFPPMELGLFRVSDIEAVESEDFGPAAPPEPRPESAEQRRLRVRRRVEALRAAGAKAFLQTVAAEEGVSPSRIKQLLDDKKEKLKPKAPASWIPPVLTRDRASLGKRKRQT